MVQMPNLSSSLGRAFWDKQKMALAKAAKAPNTTLGDELAKLTKLHLAISWDALGDDKLDNVDKAQGRASDLEEAAKGKIKALSDQAQTVETVAGKFETEAKKDSKFPKEPLVATAAIVKAAKEYRSEVAEFVASARKAVAARVAALATQQKKAAPASSSSASAAGGAESKAAKLVRTRGLDAIRKIKKPAPGAKPLRFLILQGKLTVATYMGPSVGPTQEKLLKSMIPSEAPFKLFKDPQGELIWEKNTLTFVSDRLPSGLAKKMQLWLKKILKLNLKLRVRKTTGEAEESEGEDIPDDLLELDPAEAAARLQAGKDFEKRLAKLAPEIMKALSGPASEFTANLRGLVDEVKAHGKAGEFEEANDTIDEIEAALEEGDDLGATKPAESPADAHADAMAGWQAERTAAVTSLKAVAARIAAARHPSSTKALIEINGVMKNLTPEPASRQQVAELQRYLGSDDVVNDVCSLAHDIRTPLLRALGRLQAQLAA